MVVRKLVHFFSRFSSRASSRCSWPQITTPSLTPEAVENSTGNELSRRLLRAASCALPLPGTPFPLRSCCSICQAAAAPQHLPPLPPRTPSTVASRISYEFNSQPARAALSSYSIFMHFSARSARIGPADQRRDGRLPARELPGRLSLAQRKRQ